MAVVLIPLPDLDADPTEVAVSWQVLTGAGHTVHFATPSGASARCDELMVTGRGLDPWGFLPGASRAVVVGQLLRANARARAAHAQLVTDPAFRRPRRWDAVDPDGFDALLLPGGHRARGMRPYLESSELQGLVVGAFGDGRPVAAICHGVLLAARSTDPGTGRSVLHGRTTTALTWALERRAWRVARTTRFWDPGYYRTYPDGVGDPPGTMSVQYEVTRSLERPGDFLDVSPGTPDAARKMSGRHRDSPTDERPAFVVRDGTYVSARWPGDAYTFARTFAAILTAGA